jgi:hypothetical protein
MELIDHTLLTVNDVTVHPVCHQFLAPNQTSNDTPGEPCRGRSGGIACLIQQCRLRKVR